MPGALISNLRVLGAIFEKDLRQATRYPAQIVLIFLLPFLFAVLMGTMGSYLGGARAAAYFAVRTGTTNIFVYQVLGGTMWLLSWVVIDRIGSSLREERLAGTLEQVYLSPINRFTMLLSKALVNFVTSIVTFLVVVTLSTFLFDPGAVSGLAQAFLLLALGLVPLFGISFVFAGIVVRLKEPFAFVSIMNLVFSLLMGTYYPITILPSWAQTAARFLPQTYALDGMRQILLSGTALFDLRSIYLVLLLMSVAYPVLGYLVFKSFLDRATVTGDLSKY